MALLGRGGSHAVITRPPQGGPTTYPLTLAVGVTLTPVATPLIVQLQGPDAPTAAADDASIGSNAWTNPTNIEVQDGSWAVSTNGVSQQSHWLEGTGFGFTIPTGATINGISVLIRKSTGTASRYVDGHVQLIKGGVISGTDKADGVTSWPTSDTNFTYGGVGDLWGLTLTPADVNASNFGVAITALRNALGTTVQARVDFVSITVAYTTAGVVNPLTLAATVTLTPAKASLISTSRALGVTLTPALVALKVKQLALALTATLTPGRAAQISTTRAGAVTLSPAKANAVSTTRAGAVTLSPAKANQVATARARSITLTPGVVALKVKQLVLALTMTLTPALQRSVGATRAVAVTLTAACPKQVRTAIRVAVNLTASLATSTTGFVQGLIRGATPWTNRPPSQTPTAHRPQAPVLTRAAPSPRRWTRP